MLTHDLRHFKLSEFKHPELVNETAAELLDEIRHQFNRPLKITDDARLSSDLPIGTSGPGKSLHYVGQAFDLHIADFTEEELWLLDDAVHNVANWVCRGTKAGVEWEVVWSSTDKHAHIGFFLGDGRKNRFFVRAE